MSCQLQVLGLPFSIQEGIDGKTYDFKNVYNETINTIKRLFTRTSRKGCALSHKLILEKSSCENLDYVLILEDDVELPLNFKQILDEELSKREAKTN